MNVLALNCGSSSVKFRLVAVEPGAPAAAGRALAERTEAVRDGDHASAVQHALELARSAGPIEAVGHRVVHGGPRFTEPALIDDEVIGAIEELETLAPLHNRRAWPASAPSPGGARRATPMVAVFDTAFHAALPERAWRYAIPQELASSHGIRRYGFHGISYAGPRTSAPRCSDARRRVSRRSCSTSATAARRRRSAGGARWTRRWGSRRSKAS